MISVEEIARVLVWANGGEGKQIAELLKVTPMMVSMELGK